MKRWLLPAVCIALIALVAGLYASGYRLGHGLSIVKARTLTITDLPSGASVYADSAPRGQAQDGKISLTLVPGPHTIIVDAQNYWPWEEIVTVPDEQNLSISAFEVPTAPAGTLLSGEDATATRELIKRAVLPTKDAPLMLGSGCALVYVTSNQIIADAATTTATCTPPAFLCTDGSCGETIVFTPVEPMTSVLAYPGRQDALLVTVGQNVYALELDPRSPRSFAPVLHGVAPKVAARADGTVVVEDQSSVYELSL